MGIFDTIKKALTPDKKKETTVTPTPSKPNLPTSNINNPTPPASSNMRYNPITGVVAPNTPSSNRGSSSRTSPTPSAKEVQQDIQVQQTGFNAQIPQSQALPTSTTQQTYKETGVPMTNKPTSSYAIWNIESPDVFGAYKEGKASAFTSYSSTPYGQTYEQYVSNKANIAVSKEVFKFQENPAEYPNVKTTVKSYTYDKETGVNYPNYEYSINLENTYNKNVESAKQQFLFLPASEKAKYIGTSFSVTGINTASAVTEFGASIPLTFSAGKYTKVYMGGTFAQTRTAPSFVTSTSFLKSPIKYVGQVISSPSMLANIAYTGVPITKAVGSFNLATKSLSITEKATQFVKGIGYLSPIRTSEGIFTPLTDTSKFRGYTFKETKNGIELRSTFGKSTADNSFLIQKSATFDTARGKVTTSITGVNEPFIKIEGGLVDFGRRTTISKGVSVIDQTGNKINIPVNKLVSFEQPANTVGSRGITPRYTYIYKSYTGKINTISTREVRTKVSSYGGVSNKLDEFRSGYISGFKKPIYKTELTETGFLYKPTTKYKLTNQFTGVEYDLDAIRSQSKGIVRIGKTPTTKDTTTTIQSNNGNLVNTNIQVQRPTQSSVTPVSIQKVPTITSQITKQVVTPVSILSTQQLIKNTQTARYSLNTISIQQPTVIDKIIQKQSVIPATIQDTAFRQDSRSRSSSVSIGVPVIVTPTPSVPSPTYNPNTGWFRKPFMLLPSFGQDEPSRSTRRKGAYSISGVSPSTRALIFKITGKASKVSDTSGFGFRPITKGAFKVRRVKYRE